MQKQKLRTVLLGVLNCIDMNVTRRESGVTFPLGEKLVLGFLLSDFPNVVLPEHELVHLPPRATRVDHRHFALREPLQFVPLFLVLTAVRGGLLFHFRHRRVAAGSGRQGGGDGGFGVCGGGGGGGSEEDFRVCLFPGAFFVGFGEGGAHAEELSEDGAHGHGLVAGLGRRVPGRVIGAGLRGLRMGREEEGIEVGFVAGGDALVGPEAVEPVQTGFSGLGRAEHGEGSRENGRALQGVREKQRGKEECASVTATWTTK